MKKLLVIFAAVALIWAFAAPASAVDWNFYGSARMATYYVSTDLGDSRTVGGDDGDSEVQWDLQGNSRLGATVKGDNVGGRFELGLKGNAQGDVDVGTRRIYGTWNFGAGTLKVGKDYGPTNQFISGQVFAGDLGLLGFGTFYGDRIGQIAVSFGGFEIAAITANDEQIETVTGVETNGDADRYLPKIEAKWGMAFDTFNFNIRGGYMMYTLEDVPDAGTTAVDRDDVDVTAWMIGADGGVNFGPGYIKAAVSYSQNPGDARWLGPKGFWDGDDDMDDTTFTQVALVGGLKISDQLTFEVGGGWTDYDWDVDGAEDYNQWAVYGQAVIALAPGVWIIPEVGYFDYDKDISDNDAGNKFYLGGKWQIDF